LISHHSLSIVALLTTFKNKQKKRTMKLVKFDSTNSAKVRSKQAAVTVKADGQIVINGEAFTKLGLKAGDTIAVLQDSENPKSWFIIKDKDGFKLRTSGKTSPTLVCNNEKVASALLASLGIKTENAVRFKLNTEPVKHDKQLLYAIDTKDFRINEPKAATEEAPVNA
jgi:bifunctional DNA-binding transcriptional regulator/antitoxin component of YhaV-PrlF toxin-antitoxin module